MKCEIEFSMDNAGFVDDIELEASYLVAQIAVELCLKQSASLRDINGNSIGSLVIKEEE